MLGRRAGCASLRPGIRALCGASAPVLPPPSAPEEEEGEEEESPAGELETVEVTLGTLDLREFEVMPKRNRKKRKKRDKKVKKGKGLGAV